MLNEVLLVSKIYIDIKDRERHQTLSFAVFSDALFKGWSTNLLHIFIFNCLKMSPYSLLKLPSENTIFWLFFAQESQLASPAVALWGEIHKLFVNNFVLILGVAIFLLTALIHCAACRDFKKCKISSFIVQLTP